MTMLRTTVSGLTVVLLLTAPARSAETLATFTLDASSYVSFGDEEVLALPAGSTIRFRFGKPDASGAVPFTIRPGDVSIAPVDVPSGGTLHYSLASTATGTLVPSAEGRKLSFQATVRARLDSPNGRGSFDYAMPFTTESAAASNRAGTETLEVSGMRLVEGAWYGQIVGATTNRENAFPEPGAAVTTVLSGSFDRVPYE